MCMGPVYQVLLLWFSHMICIAHFVFAWFHHTWCTCMCMGPVYQVLLLWFSHMICIAHFVFAWFHIIYIHIYHHPIDCTVVILDTLWFDSERHCNMKWNSHVQFDAANYFDTKYILHFSYKYAIMNWNSFGQLLCPIQSAVNAQTPSVYHCLQNRSGYVSDKFIRQSKICMTQSKLVLLGSDFVTEPGLSKSKHQILLVEVLIVKNCQC